MPVAVIFPKFNVERTSGEISSWEVSDGDFVSAGDTLFVVEDDKASVEVECTADGYISGLAELDTEIDVGAVVANIYASKEEIAAAENTAPVAPKAAPVVAEEQPQVVAVPQSSAAPKMANDGINPTPLARKIARDNHLSLAGVAGSGPRGRVQKRDVLALLEQSQKQPQVQPQAAQVATDIGPLHATWYQQGEGVPVVFIHGFGSDYTSWNRMLYGAQYAWPALAVDLPCHGQSPMQVPQDLDACAAAVESTLLAQGVTEMVIAAHSLGSVVAARIAARGNVNVRGLCLYAPAGLSPEISTGFIGGMCRARSKQSILPWLRMLVHDSALISDAFCERALASRDSEEKFAAVNQFALQFFPDQTQRFNVIDDLASVQAPVRVIYGRQDRILNAGCVGNLPDNVAVHLWHDCGHMPQFEHHKQALRILQEVHRSC